ICSEYWNLGQLRQGNREHCATGPQIKRVAWFFALDHRGEHLKAASSRAVMACAECKPSLDLDRDVAGLQLVAVVRSVDKNFPGPNGLQALQRLDHPVNIVKTLMFDLNVLSLA